MAGEEKNGREASSLLINLKYESLASEALDAAVFIAGTRFLVLTNYYDPEPTGSAPPITDLCRWLAAHDADVSVVTTRPSYPARRVFAGYASGERDRETLDGVHVRRLPTLVLTTSGMVSRLIGEASFALRASLHALAKAPNTTQHTIVVCPSILTVMVATAYRPKGGRLTAIVHDVQSGLARALKFPGAVAVSKGLAKLEAWSLNRCDGVITLSADMEQVLRRQGVTRPIEIMPPQVDVSEFLNVSVPLRKPPLILYSGNFGRKQGLEQLIDLAEVLMSRGVEGRVVLRGAGSERDALDRAIRARGLTNITVEPLAPRNELPQRFAESAVHLVPQDPRGANFAVPSKVFTIMAATRPFVGTAEAGSPLARLAEETGAGFCTAPGDAGGLADAVQQLLENPTLQESMGAAGRRYVEHNVDREIVCRKIAAAIIGVL